LQNNTERYIFVYYLLHQNLLSICLVMGKAERTKQFIIEKTATLFNTKGIAATSLQDMTEATGLTKGVFMATSKIKMKLRLKYFAIISKRLPTCCRRNGKRINF
jgi:hypothetical protein